MRVEGAEMEYGTEAVAIDLDAIRADPSSSEAQARVEHLFLQTMNKGGLSGLADLLRSIPRYGFRQLAPAGSAEDAQYSSSHAEGPQVLVEASTLPGVSFIDVRIPRESTPPPEGDPRHEAFYGMWESMLGMDDASVETLEPPRRAVFLIGLLESQLMNGGFGQYLTNTEGIHIETTLQFLDEIGASGTRDLLLQAARLGDQAESFVAAWESSAEDFSTLDDKFLAFAEDLAGMTAEAFLKADDGSFT